MRTYHLLFLFALGFLFACEDDNDNSPNCSLEFKAGTRFFEFQHGDSDDTYIAWTSDTAVINQALAQLKLPINQRQMHINGKIARLPEGCDEANAPWSWYFVPDSWQLAEISIELCDGNPDYVEDNLDEFIRIQAYCPWSAKIKREVSSPF